MDFRVLFVGLISCAIGAEPEEEKEIYPFMEDNWACYSTYPQGETVYLAASGLREVPLGVISMPDMNIEYLASYEVKGFLRVWLFGEENNKGEHPYLFTLKPNMDGLYSAYNSKREPYDVMMFKCSSMPTKQYQTEP